MDAELFSYGASSSDLLSEVSLVEQADVFVAASASLDLNGSAFSGSSTASTAGSSTQYNGSAFSGSSTASTGQSLAQVSGGSFYLSRADAKAQSTVNNYCAIVIARAITTQGTGVISFAANSDSNTTLLSWADAARQIAAGLLYNEVLSFEMLNRLDSVRQENVFFAANGVNNVILDSTSGSSVHVVSGAYKHSPFFTTSGAGSSFAAGGYFLSDVASYGFSYTELPTVRVRPGLLHADAQSGASYGTIGVLRYSLAPDMLRPQEVRGMHKPSEKIAIAATR